MKKLEEEMQSLIVDTDEIVRDSNGLVTEFRLSDWDWDEKRGWVPKPFKERDHTKRKNVPKYGLVGVDRVEESGLACDWEFGVHYRQEIPRKTIELDNSQRPRLRDPLGTEIASHFDRGVSPVQIRCSVNSPNPNPADIELQPDLGTKRETKQRSYDPVRYPKVYLPTTTDKLSEQAQKLWKYSSKKRKWDLLSL